MHEPVVGRVQFGVFETFTCAYLFQIAHEKSCEYLLIYTLKKFEMVKQKKRTQSRISGKKLRHQLRHLGRALDLKTKDLIGHL